jgi:hypothetical protein
MSAYADLDVKSAGTRAEHPGAAPKPSPPQVPVHLELLAKELAAQRDIIERLSNRLEVALSPQPGAEARGLGPVEPTCQLAAHISRMSAEVARNTLQIENLLSRLEI